MPANPYIYSSRDWESQNQGPTWAQYLAKYNQKAAANTQAYRTSTGGGTGAGSAHNVVSPGGMVSAGTAGLASYANGDPHTVNQFGQGMNSIQHGSDFQSNPDNTMTQQAYHDWLADNKSGVALLPGANNWRSVQSLQAYKRAGRERATFQHNQALNKQINQENGLAAWGASLDPRIQQKMESQWMQTGQKNAGMSEQEIAQMKQQLDQQDMESKLTNDVTQYFNDPLRAERNNQNINAQKAQQTQQLADQYNQLRIKQAQNAAGHGMLGSSVDIEHRGQLGRARDSAAVGVENNAQAQRSAFDQQSNQYKQQLLSLIHSGNPAAAQYAQQQLGAIDQNTQTQLDLNGAQQQMGSINDYANSLYSQALGGGLNAGAKGVQNYGPYLYSYFQNQGQH